MFIIKAKAYTNSHAFNPHLDLPCCLRHYRLHGHRRRQDVMSRPSDTCISVTNKPSLPYSAASVSVCVCVGRGDMTPSGASLKHLLNSHQSSWVRCTVYTGRWDGNKGSFPVTWQRRCGWRHAPRRFCHQHISGVVWAAQRESLSLMKSPFSSPEHWLFGHSAAWWTRCAKGSLISLSLPQRPPQTTPLNPSGSLRSLNTFFY